VVRQLRPPSLASQLVDRLTIPSLHAHPFPERTRPRTQDSRRGSEIRQAGANRDHAESGASLQLGALVRARALIARLVNKRRKTREVQPATMASKLAHLGSMKDTLDMHVRSSSGPNARNVPLHLSGDMEVSRSTPINPTP